MANVHLDSIMLISSMSDPDRSRPHYDLLSALLDNAKDDAHYQCDTTDAYIVLPKDTRVWIECALFDNFISFAAYDRTAEPAAGSTELEHIWSCVISGADLDKKTFESYLVTRFIDESKSVDKRNEMRTELHNALINNMIIKAEKSGMHFDDQERKVEFFRALCTYWFEGLELANKLNARSILKPLPKDLTNQLSL